MPSKSGRICVTLLAATLILCLFAAIPAFAVTRSIGAPASQSKSRATDDITEQNVVYNVIFDSSGGSAVETQIVKSGGNAVKPANPTYTGYSFVGWYTDNKKTVEYDFNQPVYANTTLYAKWTAVASRTLDPGNTSDKSKDPTQDKTTTPNDPEPVEPPSPEPPNLFITTQPLSITREEGTNTTFRIQAEGTQPLSYQWLYGDDDMIQSMLPVPQSINFSGQNTPVLALTNIDIMYNNKRFCCAVTNPQVTIYSNRATLTVIPPGSAGSASETTATTGASGSIVIVYKLGQTFYTANGVVFEMDSAPMLIDGRTYLPVRYITDPLGSYVEWDGDERKVTIILDGRTVELWVDNPNAKIDGAVWPIDPNNPSVAPIIINDRVYLPIRFVTEAFQCMVEWNGETSEITVIYH